MRLVLALTACLISSALDAEQAAKPASGEDAKPTLLALTDFVKPTEIRAVELSPDGKTLAVLSPRGDYGTVLMFIDTDSLVTTSGFADDGKSVPGYVEWVSNDRLILSVVRKFGGFAQPVPTGELIGLNREGKQLTALFGGAGAKQLGTRLKTHASDKGYAAIVDPLVSDDKFALISVNAYSADGSFTELYRMNELSGLRTQLMRAPIHLGEFLIDHLGAPRFVVGEGSDGGRKIYRRNADEWELVQDSATEADGYLTPISIACDNEDKSVCKTQSSFSRDNKSFYAFWTSTKGPASLVRVDAKTMKHSVLYSPKTTDPVAVFRTADRKDIYAVQTQDGASKIEIIDENAAEAKTLRAFAKNFSGSLVQPAGYSLDGKKALFKVSASNNSGEYYLFDLTKRAAKLLFAVDSWIDPAQMAKTTAFEVKARDGLMLHGYLTLPIGAEQKNLPMVVMPHGGPHFVRDDDSYDEWAQVLASRGYAVLKVNFRGSGGYGHDFLTAGYREWGRAMQDDVTDATQWAIKQGVADADRIAIAGASYGGYAALMGAAREPKLYRAAISYVGVSNLELMYTRGDIEDSINGENFLKRVLGEDKAELKRRSPVNLAAQIEAPVLIIHGAQDPRVPVLHGRSMRDALERAKKTVEYFEVQDEMHGFYKQENKVEAYTRMLAFLDKYLAVPASAKP